MPSFEPGGTERQMIELIRRLDRRRWQVQVACFRRRGAWLSKVTDVAPVVEFGIRSFRHPDTLGQMHAFGRWCQELGIMVVHTTDMPSNWFGLPAAAFGHVPVRIGSRREVNPGRSRLQLACQRAAYSCAHRIVANCHAAAAQLEAERVPARQVRVIFNGVQRHSPAPAVRTVPPRRVIVVGNLRWEKGHDVLLRAAVDIVRAVPDVRFDLIGDGPELRRLQAIAEASGITHAVSFLGYREDVAARLDSADLLVLPSRSEAFPNALLEGMAAGLPVVATAVGGVLEVVRADQTGLLVPPDNAPALTAAICQLMGNPKLAGRLGAAAQADVAARYSFDRMVAAFESLYLTELARGGHLPRRRPILVAS